MKTLYKILYIMAVLLPGLAVVPGAYGQSSLQKARASMENFDYADAARYYEKHFSVNPVQTDQARELAEVYIQMNDTRSAETWYARVVESDSRTAEDVLRYAHILKSQGRYGDAILQYEHYAAIKPEAREEAVSYVIESLRSQEWMANPTFFEVWNESRFNTEFSDFGLMPFQNGYVLTSDRKLAGKYYPEQEIYGWTGNPYLKLYRFAGENESGYQVMEGLNNTYHNGPGTFDRESKRIYFTRTKMIRTRIKPVNSDPTSWYDLAQKVDYVMRLEVYSASFNGSGWEDVKPFEHNLADEYSVGHPALSPDGKTLYYVSDMPGGYGDADIYYSTLLDDGSWSDPRNAGPDINTSGKEVFPFVSPDGTLYFSSDGHPGMGGLDLFRAEGNRDRWSIPENLKYPINSPADDFSLLTDESGQAGYISSNRSGGAGLDDIYGFRWAPPTRLVLEVKTFERLDDGTLLPLPSVEVSAVDISDQTNMALFTGDDGSALAVARCNTGYDIKGSREGYYANQVSIITPVCQTRNDTVFAELVFDKIVVNKPIVLENIYYDFDKWNIRPDAAIELNKLVKILSDNPQISVELGSHTDARGTKDYNEQLSQKRAESAVAYIISKGIDPERITAKGYGENVPVNGCVDGVNCDDESHQMNRRTEFKVTRIN